MNKKIVEMLTLVVNGLADESAILTEILEEEFSKEPDLKESYMKYAAVAALDTLVGETVSKDAFTPEEKEKVDAINEKVSIGLIKMLKDPEESKKLAPVFNDGFFGEMENKEKEDLISEVSSYFEAICVPSDNIEVNLGVRKDTEYNNFDALKLAVGQFHALAQVDKYNGLDGLKNLGLASITFNQKLASIELRRRMKADELPKKDGETAEDYQERMGDVKDALAETIETRNPSFISLMETSMSPNSNAIAFMLLNATSTVGEFAHFTKEEKIQILMYPRIAFIKENDELLFAPGSELKRIINNRIEHLKEKEPILQNPAMQGVAFERAAMFLAKKNSQDDKEKRTNSTLSKQELFNSRVKMWEDSLETTFTKPMDEFIFNAEEKVAQ